jgi:hypothetical protein
MRGWKTVLEPTSRIWHYYEFAKSKINYYYMERNRYVLPLTYYRLPTLILLAPLFVALDVATLIFSVRGGWADMKGKVYRDFASKEFWSWIWSRRKQAQRLRTISDRAFLRLATAEIAFQQDGVKNPVLTYLGNPLMRIWWRSLRAVMWW